MQNRVKELLLKIKAAKGNGDAKLPSGCYFLNEDEILCETRATGDSRYPYSYDGLNLWAYSSGNVKIEESRFNVMLDFACGKEPNLAFFVGKKMGDKFFPVSITGAGKLPFEQDVVRYVVYAPESAYYFVEAGDLLACVRMCVNDKKNVCFTAYIENVGSGKVDTYVASYFDCILMIQNFVDEWTKYYRICAKTEYGFMTEVMEYLDRKNYYKSYACIKREKVDREVLSTTSRIDFNGGTHAQLNCSTALQNGRFDLGKDYTEFNEYAVAGDIVPMTLEAGQSFEMSYALNVRYDKAEAIATCVDVSTDLVDAYLYADNTRERVGARIPEMKFVGYEGNEFSDYAFNCFVKNVFRQVEFCTRAKNYAGAYIGIRDIFQQLEGSQMWIPGYCRKKIVEAIGFISDDGRAPRQYSYPQNPDVPPAMDLRAFIDQGVWIIATVYKYVCHSGDYSILDEVCGYYHFEGDTVLMSKERDTVLDHLVRIADFLTRNLDESTDCLHALYGDWNDALNGLGNTTDEGKEFGTGVSVMATLQFYQNLVELAAILVKKGRTEKADEYLKTADRIWGGVQKYAVEYASETERKIIHGWGDKMEWKVGSYCDSDGENRDGLTSNAYWVISGILDRDPSYKKDILALYDRLDSKYGIKTFEPYFAITNKEVGEIAHLPKGTAENGAVYIHATLFAIWSLFEMGEGKRAWEQLIKILPPTHSFISTSPFIMPNSYIENQEKGFDGESCNDWFTGSGAVLSKVILWYVFGVRATLDEIVIGPEGYLPFAKAEITLITKDTTLHIVRTKGDKRCYKVDGKVVDGVWNERMNLSELHLAPAPGKTVEIEIVG